MKYKKAAALIAAIAIIFQPVCLVPRASAFDAADAVEEMCARIASIDWVGLAARFSAFTGMFFGTYSSLREAVENINVLGILKVLSFLYKNGMISGIIEKLERDPPSSFSISI